MDLAVIPWEHGASDFGAVWQWTAEHFVATVTGDTRSVYWRIANTVDGKEQVFADGNSANFQQAEKMVRETVGKAYPIEAGYHQYAGNLVNTFTLGDGREFDFTPWLDRMMTLTVITDPAPHGKKDPETTTVQGVLRVSHYNVTLTSEDSDGVFTTFSITPTYITLVATGEGVPLATRKKTAYPQADLYTRMVDDVFSPACTGAAGILPGVIDHTGCRSCPVHEMSRR